VKDLSIALAQTLNGPFCAPRVLIMFSLSQLSLFNVSFDHVHTCGPVSMFSPVLPTALHGEICII